MLEIFFYNFHKIIVELQLYVMTPYIITLIILSAFWDLYFLKLIRYYSLRYRNSLSARESGFDNSKSVYFRNEMTKYRFLLILNITEMLVAGSYLFTELFSDIYIVFKHENVLNNDTIDCSVQLSHVSNFQFFLMRSDVTLPLILCIGEVAMMFAFVFGIFLMKVLQSNFRNINYNYKKAINVTLIVTSIIGIGLIIFAGITKLRIIQATLQPIILSIYFIFWMKQIKRFHQVLKWRAVEMKVSGRISNVLVRRAKINVYQFDIIMTLNGIGFACSILGQVVSQISFLILNIVYYGPCIFNLVYSTPLYDPKIAVTKSFIDIFDYVTTALVAILVILCLIFIGLHYILFSLLLIINNFYKQIMSHFKRGTRFRFSPSLVNPLLFKHQEK